MTATYTLDGDLGGLSIPLERPADPGERLWEHTCFELFIARPDTAAYHELNFAPHGAFAAYSFERYRSRSADVATAVDPQINVRRAPDALKLTARIDLTDLSQQYATGPLMLGVSAVIEESDGELSYWALAHPAAKPDFHHRDAFVLHV